MKKILYYICLAYLLLALQAVFFRNIKPDFILIIVCYFSLKYGRLKGTVYGALMGMLIDSINGMIIGPNIIAKSLAAFFIQTLKENFYEWNIINNTMTILLFSVMNIVIIHACFEIFSSVPVVNRSIGMSVLEVVYTVIMSFVMYPLVKPWQEVRAG